MQYRYSVLSCISTLLLCITLTPAFGSTDDWQSTRTAQSAGDIATWKQSNPSSSLDAFKGEVTVPYGLLTIIAVLADTPNLSHWVFQCDHAVPLQHAKGRYAHLFIKGIWPVKDRDVILHSTFAQDSETLAVTIHSVAATGLLPVTRSAVRMPKLDNTFILTPISSTSTHITFITAADPGGMIPHWLANFVTTSAPFDTLRDMQKRMALPQYHLTRIDALSATIPDASKLRLPNTPHT